MKHITRIPAPMFILVDEMLNEELEINEAELRQFLFDVVKGVHSPKCYHIREGETIARVNPDGSLTAPLQGLNVILKIQFDLFKFHQQQEWEEFEKHCAEKGS